MVDIVKGQPGDGESPKIVETSGGLDFTLQIGALVLKRPRDEGGEAAGSILEITDAEEMLDPGRNGFANTEHHRRGGPKPEIVRHAVDIEPLARARLRT